MTTRILLFTQPGCLSCELMKVYLEARQVGFEERNVSADAEARREMMEDHDSSETQPWSSFRTKPTRSLSVLILCVWTNCSMPLLRRARRPSLENGSCEYGHSSFRPFVSGNCVVISAASRYDPAHK